MKEGQRVTIQVDNNTAEPEIVHWHGLHIPSEVDGSVEEGTPMIAPHSSARYSFVAAPSGTRWYHTHVMAMRNLKRGAYSGQFGFIYIEPKNEPGAFDQEVFLALREWDPYFTTAEDSMDVGYKRCSINSHALGFRRADSRETGAAGDAADSERQRHDAAAHCFCRTFVHGGRDGRESGGGSEERFSFLELGPAERIDAMVEMNQPGVWILGATDDRDRKAGLGIVCRIFRANWRRAMGCAIEGSLGLHGFRRARVPMLPPTKIPLVIEKKFAGSRWVDKWTINGKSWPKTDPIRVKEGERYRLVFDNRSDEAHPVHLHRHRFELTRIAGVGTSGIYKDVVVVPAKSVSRSDFVADNPGKTLFHCHQQMHMDYGFMSLMEYDVTARYVVGHVAVIYGPPTNR